jgi:hypothetical protein
MKRTDFKPTNPKDRLATNRLDLSLFPDTAVCYGAIGMTEGDSKYGGYNYRVGGVLASVYYAAARRHLAKWFNGEWADRKTRVPHLASAIACIAILIDAVECNVLRDDRPPAANIDKFLTACEELVAYLHGIFPNGPARFTELVHGKKARSPKGDSIATPKKHKTARRGKARKATKRRAA